jgi:UDP-2,4-diacetamido-2,4,6-trideoxy-beta-L-altropyranose hydrolase
MRCLTLAEELRNAGSSITFVCRDLPGNLLKVICDREYQVAVLRGVSPPWSDKPGEGWQQDLKETISALQPHAPFDWIVVDHYQIERQWESSARAVGRRIMVIDDLANRPHDCDLLLDQNYYRDAGIRYRGLVSERCKQFLGPTFALLRKEFRDLHVAPRERLHVRRALVFFGGADPTGETEKVLRALRSTEFSELKIDVVLGISNPRVETIRRLCSAIPNVILHVQTDRMVTLMSHADLAIGAGGAATWERLKCGLPTITVVTAPNQRETTMDLATVGAIWYLGHAEEVSPSDYEKALREAVRQPEKLTEISRKATAIMGSVSPHTRSDGFSQLVRAIVEPAISIP